jgi:hypothetical protein
MKDCTSWGIFEDPSVASDNLFLGNRLFNNALGPISFGGTNSQAIRNVAEATVKVADSGGFRQTIDGWFAENVAANITTPLEISRFDVPAGVAAVVGRFRAVRDGSVTGIVVTSTADCTAGSLTATVYKNTGLASAVPGTATSMSLSATLNSTAGNTRRKSATAAARVHAFDAGDEIYIAITTDMSWAPTTADIRCAIEIED